MLLVLHILICVQDLLVSESERFVDGRSQPALSDKGDQVFQKLSCTNCDTSDHHGPSQSKRCDIRHILLLCCGQEANDGYDAATSACFDALCNSSRATILQDMVCAFAVGNLQHLFGPIGGCLVIDPVMRSVLLFDGLELLIRRRRNNGGRPSSSGEDETDEGDATRACID